MNIYTKLHEDTTITCEVMAQTRYKWQNYDLWPLNVILTFDIESLFMYLTHLHIRVNISDKYHEDITVICEVMTQTSYKLHNFDLWPLRVTLTFDIELWVLYVTRLHIKVNISTNYHEDTTITPEVMGRTRYKLHNFDLWPLNVTLTFDIE